MRPTRCISTPANASILAANASAGYLPGVLARRASSPRGLVKTGPKATSATSAAASVRATRRKRGRHVRARSHPAGEEAWTRQIMPANEFHYILPPCPPSEGWRAWRKNVVKLIESPPTPSCGRSAEPTRPLISARFVPPVAPLQSVSAVLPGLTRRAVMFEISSRAARQVVG